MLDFRKFLDNPNWETRKRVSIKDLDESIKFFENIHQSNDGEVYMVYGTKASEAEPDPGVTADAVIIACHDNSEGNIEARIVGWVNNPHLMESLEAATLFKGHEELLKKYILVGPLVNDSETYSFFYSQVNEYGLDKIDLKQLNYPSRSIH